MLISKNYPFKSFIRYGIVGVLGTAVDVVSLYILVEFLKLPLLVATTGSFLLAVSHNFILNKIWTFENKSTNYKKLYIKFLLVSAIGLLLTDISMFLQAEVMGLWYIYAKLITSILVLAWNFLGNKYWTFSIKGRTVLTPRNFEYVFSIIIPAFNEEKRIAATLRIVHNYIQARKCSAEIIVVDDGSHDNTSEIVRTQKKAMNNLSLYTLAKNKGKGRAVKAGIEKAQGEYILFTDADNSTPIEELDKLYAALQENKSDIAIGSRYMPGSNLRVRQPYHRILIGRIGNLLIRLFLLENIKDTQCGFKLFKQAVAQDIFSRQKIKRWGFDMEVLAIAKMLNYKIAEVPVSWVNSGESRIRPIRDALQTFIELIGIKLNLLSGRYKD
jgi:dolichyl-phosphate beta-glucosyltransferase